MRVAIWLMAASVCGCAFDAPGVMGGGGGDDDDDDDDVPPVDASIDGPVDLDDDAPPVADAAPPDSNTPPADATPDPPDSPPVCSWSFDPSNVGDACAAGLPASAGKY